MEVSALKPHALAGLRGPTPLLRLQSDERLVALTRRGNQAAFETLVARYSSRLLAFCRHMLNSREDAEDVLQEVFAASFNAMVADERPINVRPWLYRIARNRSLNHLRRQTAIGVDSMDVHFAENGTTTADKVHKREEFRQLVGDVQELPETQRTALLLREIDALSYEQIADVMETTVPSVKSLLVRARVSLAEMSEARKLTCEEVRFELGEVAEGLKRTSAPVRRHLKTCDRCSAFRQQLKDANKALAAVMPVAPLRYSSRSSSSPSSARPPPAATSAASFGSAAAATTTSAGAASALSAGMGTIASQDGGDPGRGRDRRRRGSRGRPRDEPDGPAVLRTRPCRRGAGSGARPLRRRPPRRSASSSPPAAYEGDRQARRRSRRRRPRPPRRRRPTTMPRRRSLGDDADHDHADHDHLDDNDPDHDGA
ncbi:MAG: sigma-70 family RNA polymerase sigma factor [Solirubrobacterales bacterium]